MPSSTTKSFAFDGSHAVRLPGCLCSHWDGVFARQDVESWKMEEVAKVPRPGSWNDFFASTETATEDFMEGRVDSLPQGREAF